MSVSITGKYVVGSAGTTTVFVSCEQYLRISETLTGTPTITEVDTSDLTLASKALIATDTTVPENAPFYGTSNVRRVIPANKGLLFTVASDGTLAEYEIRVLVSTTGVTPTQVLDLELTLEVA